MTQNTTEKKTYTTPKLAKLGDIGTITEERGGDWGGSRTWNGGGSHNGSNGGAPA